MRLIPLRTWVLLFLSAALQIVIFPMAGPLPLWRAALGWFALLPFFVALLQPGRQGKPLSVFHSVLLGYVCGILWYMGTCYWIYQTMHIYGGLDKPVSLGILVLFSLYLGLYHALFAGIVSLVHTRFGTAMALLFSPFAWVAVEFARARITSFPWDLLGYSQIDNLLLTHLATFAGVMSISFFIAAINAALAWFFLDQGRRRWLVPASALSLALVVQALSGVGAPAAATPSGTAVMMQENIEVGAYGKAFERLTEEQELDQFSNSSLHPLLPAGSHSWSASETTPKTTVILWPEAPSDLFSIDPPFRKVAGRLAIAANAPVFAGSIGIERDPYFIKGGLRKYDSASVFDATGAYTGRYDKIHLVPWGEYIPYQQLFSFAKKLTEGVGDMDRGHRRSVFTIGGHSYGTFICYESIFGDEVRQFAKNGAEVLVNLSDDGWYGDSGAPWQHLNMARMRAIENRRWLLRSTNTGVTTAIDPYGRMAFQAPRHTRDAYAFPFAFEPASNLTFYTRHGDWFAWICAILTAIVAAIAYVIRIEPA
jgi:apolipoprotein N-acyltransferase